MDTAGLVFAVIGVALGGGAGVGILRWLIDHGRKHKEIDMRLNVGDSRFTIGSSWFSNHEKHHKEIERMIGALGTGVRELLVAQGLRQPGQGLNGEGTKDD